MVTPSCPSPDGHRDRGIRTGSRRDRDKGSLQEGNFIAEAYLIELSPDIHRDDSSTKYSYYLTILSPTLSRWRGQEVSSFLKSFSIYHSLHRELKDFIAETESFKDGKIGWERSIQEAIGIYRTPEQALTEAIKKWGDWENNYRNDLADLNKTISNLPLWTFFSSAHEQFYYLITSSYEEYAQYRYQLAGFPRKVSYLPTTIPMTNLSDNREKLLSLLEREILSRIFQDTLATIEHINRFYSVYTTDSMSKWLSIKSETTRFLNSIKNEVEQYYQMGLFYRQPDRPYWKSSQNLIDIIDNLLLTIDKLNLYFHSEKGRDELQNLLLKLHSQITDYSIKIY
ncbi:MAG: hypothetical protein QME16_00620 [Planctomycetota bacterium]|nr:hypothetical protein [Planctomycetota bacterium]